MKKLALTAAMVAFASAASAGNVAPMAADPAPMVEMTEMAPKPAGSGALGWILPLVAIAAIALAVDD